MKREIKVFKNSEDLNRFAAERFVRIGSEAIEKRGRFTVALAGGSTPKSLYRLLASCDFKDLIDWRKVYFFLGDERNLPPDHKESNFRMAKENLFEPLRIAPENIFRWKTEFGEAGKVAENYAEMVRNFFELKAGSPDGADGVSPQFPRFDLVLLGMGEDGHTASLFPETSALRERDKIAAANPVEKLETVRLTLTFPVINNAANVIFLAAGKEKAAALQMILEGEFQPEKYPAQYVLPSDGELFWLADEKAASNLKN